MWETGSQEKNQVGPGFSYEITKECDIGADDDQWVEWPKGTHCHRCVLGCPWGSQCQGLPEVGNMTASVQMGTLMQDQNQESDGVLGSNGGPLKALYLFFCPGMYVRS